MLECVNVKKTIHNESEVNECGEHFIEFFESGKDAPKALESAEQPLHLVASFAELTVILPWSEPIHLGWHHWLQVQIEYQLPCLIAFIGPIHDHGLQRFGLGLLPTFEEFTSLRPISGLSR
jgi:hypothetical protein